VKKNPIMSEFYVRVVLSSVRKAYEARNDESENLFFQILFETILEGYQQLALSEEELQVKVCAALQVADEVTRKK
jgi:hypothetical protein